MRRWRRRPRCPREPGRLPLVVRGASPAFCGLAVAVTLHSAAPPPLVGGTAPHGDSAAPPGMPAQMPGRVGARLPLRHPRIPDRAAGVAPAATGPTLACRLG